MMNSETTIKVVERRQTFEQQWRKIDKHITSIVSDGDQVAVGTVMSLAMLLIDSEVLTLVDLVEQLQRQH